GGGLSKLGEGGWWVGLAVAAIYFGMMDSNLAGGKTFGKRLMRIEVRRAGGGGLSPFAAFLRFIPLALVYIVFFGERFGDPSSAEVWGADLAAVLVVLAMGTFAIAHPQRRQLQDLLADSVVVRAGSDFFMEKASSKEPAIVFATLAALIILAVVPLELVMAKNPLNRQLSLLRYELSKRKDIRKPGARLSIGVDDTFMPTPTLYISALVSRPEAVVDAGRSARLAREIASEASSLARPISAQINVKLSSGFTIGIWREMESVVHRFPAGRVAAESASEPQVIFRSTHGRSQKDKLQPQLPSGSKGAAPAPKASGPKVKVP
nr:RDD family protein [bacterium]